MKTNQEPEAKTQGQNERSSRSVCSVTQRAVGAVDWPYALISKTPITDNAANAALDALSACESEADFKKAIKSIVANLIRTCRELESPNREHTDERDNLKG